MSRASRGIACATALCLAGAQSDPASAAEWGVSVGSGILYTDNLERTPDGKEVTLATTDLAGQLLSVGDQYDVDVEASVIWREYFDSAYDTDLLPQMRGEFNYAPSPEHFVWTVRDNFGQVALSPGEILQPIDRQDINVFSTGPAVTVPFGPRVNVLIAGLYSDVYYADDDFDYNRESGSLTVEREISVNQVAYIRGFAHRTDFKDETLGGYDYLGYFVGYDGVGARTGLTAEVGIEELHDGGENEDGLYVNFDVDRMLGEHTSASLAYISQYADSADIFSLDQNLEPILGGTANVLVSGDPVWLELASFDIGWEGARTSFDVGAFWSNEDADSTVEPDREIFGFGATASHWFTDSARIGASVYKSREDWSGPIVQTQNDLEAVLEFEVQLSPKMSLITYFETYHREDSPADYDENRFMVLFRYTPKAIRTDLPSFYERRLNRRFVVGRETDDERSDASGPRDRP